MGLFGQLVRTAVNTALLPVAIAKDAVTLGDDYMFNGKTATQKQIEKLKREAEDEDDDD